jgi:hypothetical protein
MHSHTKPEDAMIVRRGLGFSSVWCGVAWEPLLFRRLGYSIDNILHVGRVEDRVQGEDFKGESCGYYGPLLRTKVSWLICRLQKATGPSLFHVVWHIRQPKRKSSACVLERYVSRVCSVGFPFCVPLARNVLQNVILLKVFVVAPLRGAVCLKGTVCLCPLGALVTASWHPQSPHHRHIQDIRRVCHVTRGVAYGLHRDPEPAQGSGIMLDMCVTSL